MNLLGSLGFLFLSTLLSVFAIYKLATLIRSKYSSSNEILPAGGQQREGVACGQTTTNNNSNNISRRYGKRTMRRFERVGSTDEPPDLDLDLDSNLNLNLDYVNNNCNDGDILCEYEKQTKTKIYTNDNFKENDLINNQMSSMKGSSIESDIRININNDLNLDLNSDSSENVNNNNDNNIVINDINDINYIDRDQFVVMNCFSESDNDNDYNDTDKSIIKKDTTQATPAGWKGAISRVQILRSALRMFKLNSVDSSLEDDIEFMRQIESMREGDSSGQINNSNNNNNNSAHNRTTSAIDMMSNNIDSISANYTIEKCHDQTSSHFELLNSRKLREAKICM